LSRQFAPSGRPPPTNPASVALARNRTSPRRVLPASPVIAWSQQFQQAAGVESSVLLEALSSQYATHRSLPDMMVDMGMLSEDRARRVWADSLGCRPAGRAELTLNQELYRDAGP